MRTSIRDDVLASCRASGDPDLDRQLYAATCEEVSKGWLIGPLGQTDLDNLGLWLPSRRFAVKQGFKVLAY